MALIKPPERLVREDLEDFALWEAVPGDDEGRVRPVASRDVPDDGSYLVACDVDTATGRRLLGWLRVDAGAVALDDSHYPIEWQLRLPLADEGALRVGTVAAPPLRARPH